MNQKPSELFEGENSSLHKTFEKTGIEVCSRCGVPRSEWKGRWEEPLCRVGPTTYEQHIIEKNIDFEELFENLLDNTGYAYDWVELRELSLPFKTFIDSLLKKQKESDLLEFYSLSIVIKDDKLKDYIESRYGYIKQEYNK